MRIRWVRVLFGVAGAYDLGIGLAFLVAGPTLYRTANVPEPNHWGYVQFASLLLATFGLMFFAVAARPYVNRNLIPYGVLLKASYVAVVGYHWATDGIPSLFLPFAAIDAVMLVLFVAAYGALRRGRPGAAVP